MPDGTDGVVLEMKSRLDYAFEDLLLGIIAFSVGSASPALAQRFPFERSFDVTGPSALDVSTIRGKIEVTAGEPGRIVVVGTATVRVDWNVPANAADLARKVADNPPIQRDGQTVRLRPPSEPAEQRAVTVSYQVRVPPETEVAAASESGATTVRGVTRAVVIRTQSGAIDVMELGGTAVVTSGSGSVTVEGVEGSLTVTTNSSSVTARSVADDPGCAPRAAPLRRRFPAKATPMSRLGPARFD